MTDSSSSARENQIKWFWKQDMPKRIARQKDAEESSPLVKIVIVIVILLISAIAWVGVAAFMGTTDEDASFQAALVVGIPACITIYYVLFGKAGGRFVYAITDLEVMRWTDGTEQADVKYYLDHRSRAQFAEGARAIYGIAQALVPEASASPSVTGSKSHTPSIVYEYADIKQIDVQSKDATIILKNPEDTPIRLDMYCESPEHMAQILDFLQERCPNAAISGDARV